MNYTVKADRHRFRPIHPGLVLSDVISAQVCFDYNCRYDLKSEDQQDINKLFGVGFFPHHHRNSARFGWRWNTDKEVIELFAYVYSRGNRKIEYLADVKLGRPVDLMLTISKSTGMYGFMVDQRTKLSRVFIKGNPSFIGYRLGPYFGGNRPAPQNMRIWISPR